MLRRGNRSGSRRGNRRGRDRLRRKVRWRRGIAVTRRGEIWLMTGDRGRHRNRRRGLGDARCWTPIRRLTRRRTRRC